MKRHTHLVSAQNSPRWCRKPAFITWKSRSSASPAGTRPIRMLRNGTTSPVRNASGARCSKPWSSKMAERAIRLPDVGEGVAEAELVEWHVKIGDLVGEDDILAAVMTDKATVEIPSPVEGEIVWLGAEIGDVVAVGSDLVRLKVRGEYSSSAPTGARVVPRAKAPAAETVESAPLAKRPVAD